MNTSHPTRGLRAWGCAALAAALLWGCGGVGTGGTGAYVESLITGFASVLVGGVEFDDAQAGVLDDDGAAVVRAGGELRLGMTVEVDGSGLVTTPSGKRATAGTFRIATAVLGPVAAIDAGTSTLTVLGQQVRVNAATVFGNSLHGGLAALRVGDVVAVYGMPDAVGGRYLATRVEASPGAKAWRLRGLVSGLDAASHSFTIGGATLDYTQASGVPAGLANGMLVRVRLPAAGGAGALHVDAFGGAVAQPADGESALVDGLVTSFAGSGAFSVNGIAVDASQAQIDASAAPLAAGAFVSIDGRIGGGVLRAASVKVLSTVDVGARQYQLAGSIAALDTAAQTFTLRNVVVDYSSAVFDGGSASSLAVGVSVRVRGPLSADGTQLRATHVTLQ